MRLILDTHIAIWVLTDTNRIPPAILSAIRDRHNDVTVSAVSIWEIAIKHRLNRADSPPFSAHEAIEYFQRASFRLLDITPEHAAFVERLPLIHGDPFDRLLLAQAIMENMQLVSYDRIFERYDVALVTWQ